MKIEIYLLSLPFEFNWSTAITLSAIELFALYLLQNTVSSVHVLLSDYNSNTTNSRLTSTTTSEEIVIDDGHNNNQSIHMDIHNSYQRGVHEKLWSNFNTIQLLELLRLRYIEIWDYIESDYNSNNDVNYYCMMYPLISSNSSVVTNTTTVTNEEFIKEGLQSNISFMKALNESVQQRSDIFSNKFILHPSNNDIQFNVVHENILEILGDNFLNASHRLNNTSFDSIHNNSSLEFYYENRLAILSIKICDYIEDLFLYPSNDNNNEQTSYKLYTNKTTGRITKVRYSIVNLLRWVRQELIQEQQVIQ